MVAVTGVDAAPVIDNDGRAESANHADHVLKHLAIPDFFGLCGGFGEAEIAGASEVEFHAVAPGGGKKLLGADESELGCLFGPKGILAAFPARQSQKRNIGVQTPGEVGENCGG